VSFLYTAGSVTPGIRHQAISWAPTGALGSCKLLSFMRSPLQPTSDSARANIAKTRIGLISRPMQTFPLCLQPECLAKGFHVQGFRQKGPDCLRASHWRLLLGDPGIERLQVTRLQANLNGRSFACWRRPPSFLWLHGFLFHKSVVPQKRAEGKRTFRPGSNLQQGTSLCRRLILNLPQVYLTMSRSPTARFVCARRYEEGGAQMGLGRVDGGCPSRRSKNLPLRFPGAVLYSPQGLSPRKPDSAPMLGSRSRQAKKSGSGLGGPSRHDGRAALKYRRGAQVRSFSSGRFALCRAALFCFRRFPQRDLP